MPEMPDLDEIMKMAQNAQNELQKAQDNLDKVEVEGAAGGGLVKIRATAKGRILGVELDESLLQPSEKTMVEDLDRRRDQRRARQGRCRRGDGDAEDAGRPAAAAGVQAAVLDARQLRTREIGAGIAYLAGNSRITI